MKPEKQLYQWDVNQYLAGINPAAQFVDYPIGDEVIRIKADGTRFRIPDEVLQTYGGKTCYERYPDGTYRAYSFTVLYAPKPPEYVYTPEERTTFEALTARVDAAIDEIKRRADSGEFTPVKGVDYFTNAEKSEMMESVSSGAVGEFREVVDSATADFNENSSAKTNDYNTNATDKLSTYNSNAEQKLESYNSNHTTMLTTYDTNAEQHTTDYNHNAAEKLEAYNQNHAAKVAEYNANAETKTAEFDSNAAALQEQIAEKANVDGYYEEMTVGDAEQLISSVYVEYSEPYGYRTTGGSADVGNREYVDAIVGGTVAWNQLVKQRESPLTANGVTSTYNTDGTVTLSGTVTSSYAETYSPINLVANHVYLYSNVILANPNNISFNLQPLNLSVVSPVVKNTSNLSHTNYGITRVTSGTDLTGIKFKSNFFDITQMFGSTIADYIYALEQSQKGAGVAWFKKLFPKDYYEYNAGELLSVGGLKSHDTIGFNQWDEALESGGINIKTGLPFADTGWFRTKNFIPIFPSTAYYHKIPTRAEYGRLYFYDVDKNFISYTGTSVVMNAIFTTPQNAHYMKFTLSKSYYGTTYNHDICINLSDPSRNGEYEPYEKHSYPLDSSLTLRGIPKLDASNNLYYDGDEYTSDGKVKRKYGVYTPTTAKLEESDHYTNLLGVPCWGFKMPSDMKGYGSFDMKNAIADKVVVRTYANGVTNYIITNAAMADFVYVSSTGVTVEQATDFIRSLTFVYELATPTTETAEPYNEIQICDDFGTEEFVSTGIVPVGHNTRYPANLRDKLQHLPDLADNDGTYLIKQTGKQMSMVHMPAVFPETPTEDGTYALKTVVTGGVATLQWVVE